MIRIVVDLMGADRPASELVKGAVDAVNEIQDLTVNLCAKKEVIEPVLGTLSYDKERVLITDCSQEITNNDIPTKAFKTKTDSSLVKGLNLCKGDDAYDGFVSCGATGAVLVSALFLLGRIGHVRPALACVLAGKKDQVCICDCGANVDCKPDMILDFAKMGTAFMEAKGIENPRVRLLSNGAEEKKGPDAIKEAHQMLKASGLNFLGNVEGKDVLAGTCDVVATDGFAGNVVLKTIEGAAKTVFECIMEEAHNTTDPVKKAVLKETVFSLLNKFDYNTKGGAVLLGVGKPLVKGHGAAVAETVYSITKECYTLAKGKMIERMRTLIPE